MIPYDNKTGLLGQLASSVLMHVLLLIPLLVMPVNQLGLSDWTWKGIIISLVSEERTSGAVSRPTRKTAAAPAITTPAREKPLVDSVVDSAGPSEGQAPSVTTAEAADSALPEKPAADPETPVSSGQPPEIMQDSPAPAAAEVSPPPAIELVSLAEEDSTGTFPIADPPVIVPETVITTTGPATGSAGTMNRDAAPGRGDDGQSAIPVREKDGAQSPVGNVTVAGSAGEPAGRQTEHPPAAALPSAGFFSDMAALTGVSELRPAGRMRPEVRLALSTPEKSSASKTDINIMPGELALPIAADIPIKVRIIVREGDFRDIRMRLTQTPYPSASKKKTRMKEKEVEMGEEPLPAADVKNAGQEKLFTVSRAERGRYALSLNKTAGATCVVDVVFTFFKGQQKTGTREYLSLKMEADSVLSFRFIMPEAVFWDDDDRFSGTIEDSDSVTKFNDGAGLVWREEKEN